MFAAPNVEIEMSSKSKKNEAEHEELDESGNNASNNLIMLDRDLKLIEAVRKHAVIYDPRYLGYKDPRVKDQTWVQIAIEIHSNPDDCRNRWRSLRDRFVREKKSMILGQKDGGTPTGRRPKPWRLIEAMSFLWEFIMHRSRRGVTGDATWVTSLTDEQLIKLESAGEDSQVKTEEEDEGNSKRDFESGAGEDGDPEEFEWISVETDVVEAPEPKRSRTTTVDEPASLPVVSSATSMVPPPHDTHTDEADDEDSLFCKSVAHTLRRLPARRKALAKLRVLQALYDAEFGNDVGPDVEVRLRKNNGD